jgi:hypothetical protein
MNDDTLIRLLKEHAPQAPAAHPQEWERIARAASPWRIFISRLRQPLFAWSLGLAAMGLALLPALVPKAQAPEAEALEPYLTELSEAFSKPADSAQDHPEEIYLALADAVK